jgi:hypothetical protein
MSMTNLRTSEECAKLYLRTLSPYIFALLILVPRSSYSENSRGVVNVRLRAVVAEGYVRNVKEARSDRVVGANIEDLADKLLKLPYTRYTLGSEEEITIPYQKKEMISILPGQNVTIRPLFIDKRKICLWMKWEDSDGMKILDSRMHFRVGESMIAGTEQTDESGIVLAVDVKAVEDASPTLDTGALLTHN